MSERNLAASVRARLLNHARKTRQDFQVVLTRFCLERLLYRISISEHANLFLLKGALLFDLWFDVPHRPTHDADFLGIGPSELPLVESTFKDVCGLEVDDGVKFLSATVHAAEIRKEANYAGIRVTLSATLDGARCKMQADIGFGDAVTPGPQTVDYPTILQDLAAPKLQAYPRYTVVAEKFEALTTLGIANSRMKDYFDLWVLAQHADFSGVILCQAISATFSRRKSSIPTSAPVGLTAAFATDKQKQTQWRAFLRKNSLEVLPLEDVVRSLSGFLMPAAQAAADCVESAPAFWKAGGPWGPNATEG